MHKKKVLVHGTLVSLKNFFSDAVSRDFDVVAILSEDTEKISIMRNAQPLEVFSSQNLPKFVCGLVDGIIFTDDNKSSAEFFLRHGLAPHKIILWDVRQGWQVFHGRAADGTQIAFFCGLEFHIRNDDDVKFFKETFWRLKNQRRMKNLNPRQYPAVLAQDFQKLTGKTIDFNNLQTFTGKLHWIKIFDATPLKSKLADKFAVRSWISEKIGDEYLIPLLGVWDDFDDINFDELPNQFVLKCNHGSGMNIIVRDKKTFNREQAREKINAWLATDFACMFLELHYTRINRKIIAEKFMANGDLPDINNYKFWCFYGKPIFCGFDSGRTADGNIANLRIDYFDMNWKPTDFENGEHPRSEHPEEIPRPKNFELMKKLVAVLAEGFAFVRVDFYEIDGKVYFGEMTFTPGAGNFYYKSEGTDEYLGSLLPLPKISPPPSLT